MRRLTYKSAQYRIDFGPDVRSSLDELSPRQRDRVVDEFKSLAELAEIAPLADFSGLADNHSPPLRLMVDELVLFYRIDRHERVLHVTKLERE